MAKPQTLYEIVLAENKRLRKALEQIADHPREQPIPQLIVRFQRIAKAALTNR
jgi:hypothetical protein